MKSKSSFVIRNLAALTIVTGALITATPTSAQTTVTNPVVYTVPTDWSYDFSADLNPFAIWGSPVILDFAVANMALPTIAAGDVITFTGTASGLSSDPSTSQYTLSLTDDLSVPLPPPLSSVFTPTNGSWTFSYTFAGATPTPNLRLSGGFFAFDDNLVHTVSLDSIELKSVVTAVPEAGTWAMMLVGMFAVGGVAAKRRRTSMSM